MAGMGWTAAQLPDLRGRTAVVTGANSGIGWHTAKELAAHGARVVLAVRDLTRGRRAAQRITAAHADAQTEVAVLNLADGDSIRAFAAQWEGPLDLLINNAGVMAPPKRASTRHGFELQFGTNHLGHFMLTGLLLPSLLAAPAARVVTVSSLAHNSGKADVLDGNAGAYNAQQAYSNSKLANLLFARELQRRAAERSVPLTSTAAHPGLSYTGLVTDPQGLGARRVVRLLAPPVVRALTQSAAAGARPTLYAATQALPGEYIGPQRLGETRGSIGPARMSPLATDEQLGRRLWQVSEDLTGLRYPWP